MKIFTPSLSTIYRKETYSSALGPPSFLLRKISINEDDKGSVKMLLKM